MKTFTVPSKRKASVLLFFFVFFVNEIVSAQSTIRGSVVDVSNKPVSQATVLLLRSKDSILSKAIISDKEGIYTFNNVGDGSYVIITHFSGYKQAYSKEVMVNKNNSDLTVETITLTEETVSLATVTVITRKPLLEQKIDRLVINVAKSITSAGNTALEVLERSPGVTVDRQNNTISMLGKNGVNVMINGKLSYMPVSAIVQMLDGMNAANIDKIELITTPPANFDAEGNAGYINIILKQNDSFGTNGSISGTLGYGKGWMGQVNLNFNHRKGKTNIFGDFSLSRTKKPFTASGYNRISNNGSIFENYGSNDRIDTTRSHSARLGIDYQAGSRTVLGILFTSSGRWYRQAEHTINSIHLNGQLDSTLDGSNSELNNWQDYGVNLSLQHHLKNDGIITFNADHIHYKNNQPFNYYTRHYDKTGNFIYDVTARSGKKTPLNFWVASADYSKKISKKISMDAGLKGTIASFTNDISYERLIQNSWMRDPSFSTVYTLKEDHSSTYVSFNITASEKTSVKAGLRYEYTNSNLGTESEKNIVNRHYGKLFPSFFLSHKLNDKNAINFSYSTRITRPTLNDLAPFTYFASPYSILTGNPALQPAISNAVSLSYSLKKYFFSVSFTKEDHSITFFQPSVDSAASKTIAKSENLENKKQVSAVLSIPVTIASWWSMQYNITGLWQQMNAIYKSEPVKIEGKNISINMSQRFKLPKDFSIELSGFYFSPSLNGISVIRSFGSLDFGMRKKLSEKGTLSVGVNDLLQTFKFRVYTDLPDYNVVGNIRLRFVQRTFKITYSRNFGNSKLKGSRNITTGAEDEKNRVQYQ